MNPQEFKALLDKMDDINESLEEIVDGFKSFNQGFEAFMVLIERLYNSNPLEREEGKDSNG